MSKRYVTDADFAQCIRETPHGETPECFKGYGFLNVGTNELVRVEDGIPTSGGPWRILEPFEVIVHTFYQGQVSDDDR